MMVRRPEVQSLLVCAATEIGQKKLLLLITLIWARRLIYIFLGS